MDEFAFGTSVWDTDPEPPAAAAIPPAIKPPTASTFDDENSDTQFDDFDDFGTAPTEPSEAADDDFDDFGDFGSGNEPAEFGGDMDSFAESSVHVPIAGPSSWKPLQLEPVPSRADLIEEVDEILAPLWEEYDISQFTSDDPIREVQGINQILTTPESRQLFTMLIQSPPPTKPPNWTRSRIRRQHLISLGIPVNLDEMLPRANGKPLPPLEIVTRPSSAPPGPRDTQAAGSRSQSRTGSPHPQPPPSRGPPQSQFGPKPELDVAKINHLLELDQDTLVLQSLPMLEKYLAEMREQTILTSSLLSHLLQARDSLQQDAETYNGLIAELVGEAQKIKTTRSPVVRRGSQRL